jgi:hypothetical protein
MTESEWMGDFDYYSIVYPFVDWLQAIKIREDDVSDELLSECVEKHIVSEVAKGYYVTHEDIEQHQEIINEHGIETYLEKRLELVEDE